ncbi:MAG TPA: CHAD domain-containing protein [Proteiniclasticum sp.]|nr:CHAD domain-containing protein [Proteiniclasticum sp.]
MKKKNILIEGFQKDAKDIFLAEDLLLLKLKENPDEAELEEIIHDLRVNFRKLISLLYFYKPLIQKKESVELGKSLKTLLRNFGSLRAQHVFLKSAQSFSQQLSESENASFNEMIEREIEKQKEIERKKENLDPIEFRVKYEEILKKLLGYGDEIFKASTYNEENNSDEFILNRYNELMNLVASREEDLDYNSVKDVHKLRVLAKNINYTLKSKEDFLGDIATKKGEYLKKIQDIAGKVHDADIHLKKISAFDDIEEEKEMRIRFMEYIRNEREENIEKLKNLINK